MKSNLKTNFIYNSAYQMLSMIVPLVTTPYISRVLGADGVGIYSYNYSIAAYFVMFILLGLNNYGNREIAIERSCKEKVSRKFWSIYSLQILLGIFINLLYFFYCIFIATNQVVALTLLFYTLSGIFDINWFFFGMEEFRITVIRNTLVKILSTVAIFLFVKKPSDINIYTLILSLSFLVSQILLWPYLIKKVYFYKPKLSEVVSHIKPNLFLFLTVVAVSIYRTMDKIMLGYLTDNLQVGYFESSEKIIQVPMLLITSLGMIMLPRMSNLANNKKSIESKKLINKSILFAMFLSSSLCFGIMGVASEFVPLFFGKGFETCIYLFWILLPSCLFLAFANVVRTQYVIPNKLDQIYVKSVFIGAIVNFLSNSLLIKNYYSIGAAIGTLLAEIAVCVYISYKIRNDLDISYMVWISVPFIISGIIMFSVLLNVKLPFESLSSIMLGKILIGVPIYMGSLLLQIIIIKLIKKIV